MADRGFTKETLNGRTVREIQLPADTSVAVIIRGGRAIAVKPDTRLTEGDRILVVTSSEREDALRTLFIGS